MDKKAAKKEQYKSIQEIKINEQEIKNDEKQESKENKQKNMQDNSYIMYLLMGFFFLLLVGIFKSVFFNKHKGL